MNKKVMTLYFTLITCANIALAEDCSKYQIDLGVLKSRAMYDRMTGTTDGRGVVDPSQGSAQAYINQQRLLYQACIANQAGTTYEETVCNGDHNCIQRYDINRQYTNSLNNYAEALKNQHMTIDTNINHTGTVNVNNQYRRTLY